MSAGARQKFNCAFCPDVELVTHNTDNGMLMCNGCKFLYYLCSTCETGIDIIDDDRGAWCRDCSQHFCYECCRATRSLLTSSKNYICTACMNMLGTTTTPVNNSSSSSYAR